MILLGLLPVLGFLAPESVVFEGSKGPGHGKSIVFLSGDEEYRSEEGLPELARILATRHGFKCTVLFSLDASGNIDPDTKTNEPGLEALDHADLCVMLLRYRQWPDEQMRHFVNYYRSGKPIIALRTSTHAFDYPADSSSPYRKFGCHSTEWPGGFGKQVLGETWVDHWGAHGKQATRGVLVGRSPILNGVDELFGTTDVYEAFPPADADILVRGQVVDGLDPKDPAAQTRRKNANEVDQPVNDPMMPIVWTRQINNEAGKTNKTLTCTMGAATDLLDEELRRLLVNAAYWAVGLERRISKRADVDFVGVYHPSPFGFEGFKKGVTPSDVQNLK